MRLIGCLAVLVSGTALGQLFAVAPGPRLVTVDPDTGQVSEIGPLALEGNVASMEFVGQRLYATESRFPNGAALIEIDTRDAAVLSRHEITLDGTSMQNAVEGLGYDPDAGSLVQGFWRPGAGNVSTSNTLGYLAMDGTIASPITLGTNADFDGLATLGQGGTLYRVDREPGPNTVEVGTVSMGGGLTSLVVYSFNATLNGVNDVTLAPDRDELLAVDSVTTNVHRFDPDTASLLGSVTTSTNEGMNAAAYRVSCPADLAPEYGLLDLSDVGVFITAFVGQDRPADLAPPYGLFDLSDVTAFVDSFNAGCP